DGEFVSLGDIELMATGSIRSLSQSAPVPVLVGDRLTAHAGTGIHELLVSLNTLVSVSSQTGDISITDTDGVARTTVGLTLMNVVAHQGNITIGADAGLSVGQQTG